MDAFRQNLTINKADGKGNGVFAKSDMPAKTIIFEFAGDVLNRDELSRYVPSDIKDFIQIGKDMFLSKSGDYGDYINHSCNPNCGVIVIGRRAFLTTLFLIKAGAEITWDYSTTSTDTKDEWSMNCKCGFIRCRKVISGFQYLDSKSKEFYKSMGVVPQYLLDA